ncbi:translocation/assembly module TamB domain-containing protein [Solilutibacter silvestris]|uniref:translocation/assembly module TamB domain-containing protein n=1 Tax=Solilutibacter silvestris TaxID=1645665 RepID=UPI003D32A81A
MSRDLEKRYGLEPLPDDATPEQREARIADLRGLRRKRARKIAWRSGLGMLLLAVLAVAGLYWLLTTIAGRDFLLARIRGLLPIGTELSWKSAEGPVSGPMTLHGVHVVYRGCPDEDGKPVTYPACKTPLVTTFNANTVTIRPMLQPLLGRKLRLDSIAITDATLDLPHSDKPFELPRWPQSLPQIGTPLPIRFDAIAIDNLAVTRVGVPLVDIRSVRGALEVEEGRLHADHLVAETDRGDFKVHGDYAPADRYRMALTASALMPAPLGRTRPVIGLAARGDLDRMDIALSGNAPAPLYAHLTLKDGERNPVWSLRANAESLDPGLLAGTSEPTTPLSFDLQGDGKDYEATLHGKFDRGDLHAVIQPSKVRLANQVLELKPVVVDIFGGRIAATGHGDFSPAKNGQFDFAVVARGLRWGKDADAIGASADFRFSGVTSKWNATGTGVAVRGKDSAQVTFDGIGDGEGVNFNSLRATMPQGRLDARGRVAWAPSLNWKADATLAGFDPGYFLPEWKGALNGRIATTGTTRSDRRIDIVVDAQQLGGKLRDRAISGRAKMELRTAATAKDVMEFGGDVALTLGGSRIDAKGRVDRAFNVDAKLNPLRLDDLLPNAAGTLAGTLKITGPRNGPDIDADLNGTGLRYGSYRAATLSARGRLPWQNGNGNLAITGSGIEAGMTFDRLEAHATGAMEHLALTANASGGMGQLSVTGNALKQGNDWRGTLSSLHLAPVKGAAWQLQAPAQFAQHGSNWTLSQSCFSSTAGGSLCANAEWPRRGVQVDGHGLPLALALPYLPPRKDGKPWDLEGEIALTGAVQPVGGSWRGNVHLTSPRGGVRVPVQRHVTAFEWQNLTLDATFDPNRLQGKLNAGYNGNGHIIADVSTGWDEHAPLAGSIDVDTRDLTLIELFSPDIVDPQGHLAGHILLAGSRAAPRIGGNAVLSEFRTDLPALGLVIDNGTIKMEAQADGNARISGNLRSGEGTLNVDGTLGWLGQDTPLQLSVKGRNVLVSDTRELKAVADPDVLVKFRAGQPLTVTGTVGLPSATIDLERLSGGATRSSDVVILDPVDPERTSSGLPLDLDLKLALGDNVNINGFGLKGQLGGSLRVRARPGRDTLATGTLDVSGRYRAYGQNLTITRGRLVWSNDPVGNPVLDVRAERALGDVTAGISVSGRASRPQADVWSDPASSQDDALALLVTGHSLSGLDSNAQSEVSAMSAALNAGEGLLASQLGSKIGLDDAGVMQSRALGGSVLGVGKYLSPKMYVGYGVSLLGTGQVLMLKYLLRKGFDIQIESSTVENRASVNWRKEK